MRDTPESKQDQWKKAGWEAARMLSSLIRINTTNPPGNETAACEFLKPMYRELGMEVETVEPEPGRGSIIGRLRAKDPEAGPLLLLSHLDVVPADPEGWSQDPFSGAVHEDSVFGRGAVDCKNATTIEWHALKEFLKDSPRLKRDIILAASADEEAGGKLGMGYICEQRPELLQAEACINEGGGYGVSLGEREVYFCQTAEKGACWFKLTAKGAPGHASVPRDDSAMERMIQALAALKRTSAPFKVSRVVKRLAESLVQAARGSEQGPDLSDDQVADILFSAARSEEIKKLFQALTRNTMSITTIQGGTKANVIPGKVEATIDCRLLPGYEPGTLLEEIKKIVGPYNVSVEPIVTSKATEMDYQGELYLVIENALQRVRPNAWMAPFMLPGGTDGRYLVDKGTKVYGFIPVLAEPGGSVSMLRKAHGVDESIKVMDLAFGIQVLYNVLKDYCEY